MTQRTGIACGDDVVTPVAAHSAGIDRFSGTTYALAQAAGCSRVLNLRDLIVSVTFLADARGRPPGRVFRLRRVISVRPRTHARAARAEG